MKPLFFRLGLAAAAFLLAGVARAAAGASQSFDLPAGEAGDTLVRFAKQSGSDILFSPQEVAGATTGAVRGEFTVREALDRMVAGTDLRVTRDGLTGAFAITRQSRPDSAGLPPSLVTYYLPSYFITESSVLRWRYAIMPGFEILSCCDDDLTQDFAKKIYAEQSLLNALIPPGLQAQSSVPTTLILLNGEIKKNLPEKILVITQDALRRVNRELIEMGTPHSTRDFSSIQQIGLSDTDSTSIDNILDRNDYYSSDYKFEPEYLFYVLARRAPRPPLWLIEGVLNFRYRNSADESQSGNLVDSFHLTRRSEFDPDYGLIAAGPAIWISPEINDYLTARSAFPPALLPMAEFLTQPPPPEGTDQAKQAWFEKYGLGSKAAAPATLTDRQIELILRHGADQDSPWRFQVWRSQAMLFVRWAFDDEAEMRRRALWRFAVRASAAPVTAAMFQKVFGQSMGEMDIQLANYVQRAVQTPVVIIPRSRIITPELELREPAESEKDRILGDWERKEADFAMKSHPEYVDLYRRQAARTLLLAYDAGARDPALLAALGLYECSAGDDARARPLLELAVQAEVQRPRAYIELARIRYETARANPAGPHGMLDAEQVASVLNLLWAVRQQLPPQYAGYEMAAEIWNHTAVVPTGSDLALVKEGLYYFPDDPRLALASIRISPRVGKRQPVAAKTP